MLRESNQIDIFGGKLIVEGSDTYEVSWVGSKLTIKKGATVVYKDVPAKDLFEVLDVKLDVANDKIKLLYVSKQSVMSEKGLLVEGVAPKVAEVAVNFS